MARRVVVTGIGAITPLGETFTASLAALHSSSTPSTIQSLSSIFEASSTNAKLSSSNPCQVAAPVISSPNPTASKQRSRFLQFALHSADDALASARLNPAQHDSTQIGTAIGTGIGSISSITDAHTLLQKSIRKINPHFVPSILCNSAAGQVSLSHNLQGPNHSVSTACATGAHAIIDSYKFVRDGDADVMLAGGTEAAIDALSLAGFSRLRAMSTGAASESMSRPFDAERNGFVMGEGACTLVLEDAEFATARGATILCEVTGYGVSGDAYHATAPDPEGGGAERSMRMALNRAKLSISDIDYINAHATSTPIGDEIEIKAISRLLGEGGARQTPLYVSSTKGATGHLLGAAGAIEAAFTIMTLQNGRIPETKNLRKISVGEYDSEALTIVKDGEFPTAECNHVMSNSFGFGGTNATLVFSRWIK